MATVENSEYPVVFSPHTKGPITEFVLEGKQMAKSQEDPDNLRTMYQNSRREGDEGTDFSINPEPVPYQPANFMSSTMMKKVPMAKRNFDTFGGNDWSTGLSKRGMMLHTDRYQWDLVKALDGLSQRERLQAELEYMERLRGIKRQQEVLTHRAQLDLLMGGKKMEFSERFELHREIQKLKSLILPQHARDLFHGRGFTLPETHNSIKPRRSVVTNNDFEDELSSPFSPDKYSYNPETGRVHPKQRQYPNDQSNILPKITNKGYLLGDLNPAHMARSKTNVTQGQLKLAPAATRSFTAALHHSKIDNARPTATEMFENGSSTKEIKIPVSVRDPDETELAPEPTSLVPKSMSGKKTSEAEVQDQEAVSRYDKISHPDRLSAPRSVASPNKELMPNPLKGSELTKSISEQEQARLKQTFSKLDTDKDGHLKFSQLQTQLPKQFTQSQEKYIKQVYDITSSNTFFGVDEFMTMSYLTTIVMALRGDPLDAYNRIDFHNFNEIILKYVDLFQSVDRNHRGKIALSSLQECLSTALSIDFKSDPDRWNKIVDTIEPAEAGTISKIEFLAHLPYFQSLRRKK